MAYQMVATAVTFNDFEGHSPVADVFTSSSRRHVEHLCSNLHDCLQLTVCSHGSSGLAELLVNSSVKNGHNISTDVARRAVSLQ